MSGYPDQEEIDPDERCTKRLREKALENLKADTMRLSESLTDVQLDEGRNSLLV